MNARLICTLLVGIFIGFGLTLLVKSPEAQAQKLEKIAEPRVQQEPEKNKNDSVEEKITLPETVKTYLKRKQLDAVIQELLALQSTMRDSQMELARIKGPKNRIKETPISDTEVENKINKDDGIGILKKNVIKMKTYLADLEHVVVGGKESPIFRKTQEEVNNLEKQMAARSRRILPLVEEELRGKALTEKTKSLEEQIRFFKEKEKLLTGEINRLAQEGISIEPFVPEAKAQEIKPTWEFKVVRLDFLKTGESTKMLNDLASERWEYVGPISQGYVVFKRKK